MRSFTCVSVVVCVARKLRPCPSYSRRRDRINLVLWRSLYRGGEVVPGWESATTRHHREAVEAEQQLGIPLWQTDYLVACPQRRKCEETWCRRKSIPCHHGLH